MRSSSSSSPQWGTKIVTFRMRQDEYEDLVQAAGYIGESISGLLRMAARRIVESVERQGREAPTDMGESLRE